MNHYKPAINLHFIRGFPSVLRFSTKMIQPVTLQMEETWRNAVISHPRDLLGSSLLIGIGLLADIGWLGYDGNIAQMGSLW